MVSKCSNPNCSASFLYLHRGKLFRFDAPHGHGVPDVSFSEPVQSVQFFWLCETCGMKFTMVRDPGRGARLVALQARAQATAAGL